MRFANAIRILLRASAASRFRQQGEERDAAMMAPGRASHSGKVRPDARPEQGD
jgi:hypothetical protein